MGGTIITIKEAENTQTKIQELQREYIQSEDYIKELLTYNLVLNTMLEKNSTLTNHTFTSDIDSFFQDTSRLVQYYSKDVSTSKIFESVNRTELQLYKEDSLFYIHFSYDENGTLTIKESFGIDETVVNTTLTRITPSYYENRYDQEVQLLTNKEFIYRIAKTYVPFTLLGHTLINIGSSLFFEYMLFIFLLVGSSIFLISLFFIATQTTKDKREYFTRIPIELYIFGLFISIPILLFLVDYYTLQQFQESMTSILYVVGPLFIYTMIILLAGLTTVLSQKNKIKERSILYKIYRKVKEQLLVLQTNILKDLNYQRLHRKLIFFILLEVLLLCLLFALCLFFIDLNYLNFITISIFFIILYLGLHYYVGKNFLRTVILRYKAVEELSKEMELGTFIHKREDLGFFNELQDSLLHIEKGFQEALDEEEKSLLMKTELISNVSHDLKTPLTVVISYIDLLKDEKLSEEQRIQYIGIIEKKANKMKYLVEDLFELSKVNSGNVQVVLEELDVNKLLKQCLFEQEEALSSFQVYPTYTKDPCILALDSNRMYRIIDNLLLNISTYALPNTRVFIDLKEDQNEVTFTFRNTMKEPLHLDVTTLSERFVRGDVSRTSENTGLGLAIVKSFMELQKGTLTLELDHDLFIVILHFKK